MWNLVRTLLFALAVAGFVGQSSAHATPFQVFEATGGMADMDCAEMMVMADGPSGGATSPCDEMTPDCIAKMGCAVSLALIPPLTVAMPGEHRASTPPRMPVARLVGRDTGPEPEPPALLG